MPQNQTSLALTKTIIDNLASKIYRLENEVLANVEHRINSQEEEIKKIIADTSREYMRNNKSLLENLNDE